MTSERWRLQFSFWSTYSSGLRPDAKTINRESPKIWVIFRHLNLFIFLRIFVDLIAHLISISKAIFRGGNIQRKQVLGQKRTHELNSANGIYKSSRKKVRNHAIDKKVFWSYRFLIVFFSSINSQVRRVEKQLIAGVTLVAVILNLGKFFETKLVESCWDFRLSKSTYFVKSPFLLEA